MGLKSELPVLNTHIRERIVKSCLDLIVLTLLKGSSTSGAYDLIAMIHGKFEVMVSPGVIYPVLFSLERDGSVTPQWKERKKVYRVTAKGEEMAQSLREACLDAYNRLLTLTL
ncbi:PadR family transcriptional regulator [Candidatus Bathyarchaeota archaeon]|nr:PadR family transcriptional regulator [Candidatus Bathyarchaeota archaeon]